MDPIPPTDPPITTPPVTTPITTPTTPPVDPEYEIIPDTGINRGRRVGVAPVIAGAATAFAGLVGGSILGGRRKDKKDEDEDSELLEDEREDK